MTSNQQASILTIFVHLPFNRLRRLGSLMGEEILVVSCMFSIFLLSPSGTLSYSRI